VPDFTPLQRIAEQLVLFLPTFFGALIIFIIFWVLGVVFGRFVRGVGKKAKFDDVVSRVMGDSVRVAIIVVGLITALGTIGVNVSALVTGVGLVSLALGLALQPIVGNAVSGMLILIYRPFKAGDTIKVLENEGKVIDITLRSVTLDGENRHILIPNVSVWSNVVVIHHGAVQPQPAQGQGQPQPAPSK
jgi:small conductance mechanosensitive channel